MWEITPTNSIKTAKHDTVLYQSSSISRIPDKLFLHQGEIPEGTDIQLEELDQGLEHPLSFRVPLQQSFSTSFTFFTTLCKINKRWSTLSVKLYRYWTQSTFNKHTIHALRLPKSSSYPPNQVYWDYSLLPADTYTFIQHTDKQSHIVWHLLPVSSHCALGGTKVVKDGKLTVDGPLQQCNKTPPHHQDYPPTAG